VAEVRLTETERQAVDAAWVEFDRNTPEAFWDVAIWQEKGWTRGSLDVADRKRIGTALLASHADAAAKILEYADGYYNPLMREGFEVAARIAGGWLRRVPPAPADEASESTR